MDKLFIVIPAYNESETIRDVIHDWYPVVEKCGNESRLVIVNDGSKDDTFEIMKEEAKNLAQFIPLTKDNGGHGATVLYAYHYALDHGAEFIFKQIPTDRPCQRNSGSSGSCGMNTTWSSAIGIPCKTVFPV